MQKLIYLGYVIDPKKAGNYAGVSIAGNKMQWNVLRCLSMQGVFDIECLSITPMAVFPKQKKIWQKQEKSFCCYKRLINAFR